MNELYVDRSQTDLSELLNMLENREKSSDFINNVFDFDSSKRAQDAFLCWCANWVNRNEGKLSDLGKEFVGLLSGKRPDEIKDVVIKTQFRVNWQDEGGINHRGYIDILLVVDDTAVIIEDKVESGIHNDQLNGYRRAVESIIERGEFEEPYDILEGVRKDCIRMVYIKTDYFFDPDHKVKEYAIWTDARMLLKFFASERYRDIDNYLFDSFLYKLCERIRKVDRFTQLDGDPDTVIELVESTYIAQHHLMRELFDYGYLAERPYSVLGDDGEKRDCVYQRMRYGHKDKPYTSYRIFGRRIADSEYSDFIWWRIDTDTTGPYLSLKLFDPIDYDRIRHEHLCKNLFNALDCVNRENSQSQIHGMLQKGLDHNRYRSGIDRNQVKWKYNECNLIHIDLIPYLQDWKHKKAALVDFSHTVTDLVLALLESGQGVLETADPKADLVTIREMALLAAQKCGFIAGEGHQPQA